MMDYLLNPLGFQKSDELTQEKIQEFTTITVNLDV